MGSSQILFVSAEEHDRIREGSVTYGSGQVLFVTAEEYDLDPDKYRRLIRHGSRVVVVWPGTGSACELEQPKEADNGRTDSPTSA